MELEPLTELPPNKAVKDVFEDLLGREVEVRPSEDRTPVGPEHLTMEAVYVDDQMKMRAVVVTDLAHKVTVNYRGILPDLFKEGKGVVAQGRLGPDHVFVADQVLAKHDENYMPPEAADALQRGAAIAANETKGKP